MAELPEWSAQALRYEGRSDGPVKVMYFRSRLEVVNNDSSDQKSAWPKERPELDKQISFKASGASDSRGVFSGHLFDDPVEVLDSKNYKLEGEEWFEDRESALGDLASKFNNSPRVLPFDIESSYRQKYSYFEPGLIKPSKEDDLLWYYFKAYATNAKDFKAVQDFEAIQDLEPVQDFESTQRRRRRQKEEEGKEKKGGEEEIVFVETKKDKRKEEEAKRKKEEDKRKEEEEKEKIRILQTRKELDGMTWRIRRQGYRCQCALIFGITTKFNPSGVWIVEDIFYDEEERE